MQPDEKKIPGKLSVGELRTAVEDGSIDTVILRPPRPLRQAHGQTPRRLLLPHRRRPRHPRLRLPLHRRHGNGTSPRIPVLQLGIRLRRRPPGPRSRHPPPPLLARPHRPCPLRRPARSQPRARNCRPPFYPAQTTPTPARPGIRSHGRFRARILSLSDFIPRRGPQRLP